MANYCMKHCIYNADLSRPQEEEKDRRKREKQESKWADRLRHAKKV